MQIMTAMPNHGARRNTPGLLLYFVLLLAPLTTLGGCYTASEMRAQVEEAPDPRRAEAKKLWEAMLQVVGDEGWSLDLKSEEDLLLTTQWMEVEPDLRKRIRLSVVVAQLGVGINANVRFERRDESTEVGWTEVPKDERAIRSEGKRQERALVERIYRIWQGE